MRTLRLLTLLGGFLSFFLPETAWMVPLSVPTSIDPTVTCFLGGNYVCTGGGATGAAIYVGTTLFLGGRIVFGAAAILLFVQYGIRLMLESGEESTISEVKSAYTYGIAGCAIVSLASLIVQIVGQSSVNTTNLVNINALDNTLGIVVHFLRILVGTAVTGVVVYQGIRLIVLQGQESEIESQKKRFFHSLIGVAVITLASTVVTDFIPGSAGSSDLALQMVGIANFLIVLIGGMAVLAFIVAGIFLIISTDDALKDRAKKTIFTTVISLIVLICVYTIINFVIQLNPLGLQLIT
jgi:hypothetical protein